MNAPETTITRRDLATQGLEALDKQRAGTIAVSQVAGGVSFATAMEVMEFAKLMAISQHAVPEHLQNNPGACLRIVFQAIEWRMSPYAVADKSYSVNKRLAYESQLIHAVVEARAPLQHRLDCKYDGEGPTRTCTVIGQFTTGDTREYTSPAFKDIKVKNSPLWATDPDQQLFYYASRSWARKWCPDVLLGIYSREELREDPTAGREPDEAAGLSSRLAGPKPGDEGHRPGHAESELDQLAAGGHMIEGQAETVAPTGTAEDGAKGGKNKKKSTAKNQQAEPKVPEQPTPQATVTTAPTNPAEYGDYAAAWIATATDVDAMDKRWATERKLRNDCGLTAEGRQPLESKLIERREQLEKKE